MPVVLGTLLFGVALASTVVLYWSVWDAYRMRQWEETTCLIIEAKLEKKRGKNGNSYKATAVYEYEHEGLGYQGTRVGIHSLAERSGWQRSTATQLETHKKQGEPHVCFVNPENPSEAILFRERRLHPTLLPSFFAFMFGGIALSVITNYMAQPRGSRNNRDTTNSEPWTHRYDWAKGEIGSSPMRHFKTMLAVIAFLTIVGTPALTLIGPELASHNFVAYALLLFPFAIVCSILMALHMLWRQAIEGTTLVRLASVPGVIGGTVSGVIQTKRDLHANTSTKMRLRCVKTTTPQGQKKSNTSTSMLWEKSHHITADLSPELGDGSAIPFDFQIPFDLPESGGDRANGVRWILEASSVGDGPRFDMSADLPVFRTKESSPEVKHDNLLDAYETQFTPGEELAFHGVRITENASGGKTFKIRGAKTFKAMLTLFLFAAGCTAISYAFFRFGGPWFVGILFGMFGLPLSIGFLHTLLWRCQIKTGGGQASIRSGATFLSGTRDFRIDALDHLSIDDTTAIGENHYYSVFIGDDPAKSVRVGKGILGREEAENFARALWQEVTDLPPPEITQADRFAHAKKKRKANRNR